LEDSDKESPVKEEPKKNLVKSKPETKKQTQKHHYETA